jgi:CheY-like chemotaxis protein
VETATDAVEAFHLRSFDLVIADIGLPDASGWDLLKLLRAVRRGFRAMALTGYCYPADLELSTEAGFDLHVTKPAEWQTIQQALAMLFPAGAADIRGSGADDQSMRKYS